MSADNTSTIDQYISFEFINSLGNVPTEFGPILYFSNNEILGKIVEGEKVSTVTDKTRGGFATGSVITLPRSYTFDITSKYDRRTWGKIRRLLEAIADDTLRIKFRIYSGYLLWEEAFGTFNDYSGNAATTFDVAIVDIGDAPTYRSIVRGHGLASGEKFNVVVSESSLLSVPTTSEIEVGGGVLGESTVSIGGLNLIFNQLTP